jgi:hypothetical protein
LRVRSYDEARDLGRHRHSCFNHINLGDSSETLTRYFGAAFQVTKSDLPDTDVWHYRAWPFSFEVNAGRVTSIRIVDPRP